jgi:osmotically-inducible protein OsmY
MNIKRISSLALIAAATLASIPAYAQNDAASTTAASPAPTKKEMRAQNRAVERAIRKSFAKVKDLDATGIFIIPRGGNVTLEGDVPEAAQIDLAVQAATATAGVTHVNNRLTIRYPGN